MSLSRFVRCLCFASCAGSSLTAAPLRAEPGAAAAAEPTGGAQATAVLVGAAGRDPELQALLSELLGRRGLRVEISVQSDFGQSELLRDSGVSGAVRVFIVPGLGGNMRLYFRAPDGERFLVRSVLLRAGLDDLGREQVGQIVETAVTALLHPGAGLTREQVEVALTHDAHDVEPTPELQTTAATPTKPPKTATNTDAPPHSETRRTTTLAGWFALRYGAALPGPELSVAHGPGLELGLSVEHAIVLRARVSVQRDFTQTLKTSVIAAEIDSLRWWGAVDAGLALTKQHSVLLSLGLGQDRSDVKPVASAGSNVAPAGAFQNQTPVVHTELRYEAGSASLRVAAAVGADASLVTTHYDVAHQNESERIAQPWLVRPSASLALAFCPHWATF